MMHAQRIAILEAFDAARDAQPRLSTAKVAERLGIAEGELQSARLGRDTWTLPLAPASLAEYLPALGHVKAVTRSPLTCLEQTGCYPELRGGERTGLLLAPGGLDLRLLYAHWHWACLVCDAQPAPGAPSHKRWSLQIFDRHGVAVHKCFALHSPLPPAWAALYKLGTQDTTAFTQSAAPRQRMLPDTSGLATQWAALRDVHHFLALLKRHGLTRLEANRAMEGRFTHSLAVDALQRILARANHVGLELMLFVSSPGCVQIQTGAIPRPECENGLLSLTTEHARLMIEASAIDQLWQVAKPNRDGGVTSLEAFDQNGTLALQIYARREEGQRESPQWRELLAELSPQGSVA